MTYTSKIRFIFSVSEPAFQAFQTSLPAIRIRHDSLCQLAQIRPTYVHCHAVAIDLDRHPEGSSVQGFRIDDHTTRLVMKQFDAITAFVHEDVHITVHRVVTYFVPDKPGEGIEALSHIGRLAVEPVPHPLF